MYTPDILPPNWRRHCTAASLAEQAMSLLHTCLEYRNDFFTTLTICSLHRRRLYHTTEFFTTRSVSLLHSRASSLHKRFLHNTCDIFPTTTISYNTTDFLITLAVSLLRNRILDCALDFFTTRPIPSPPKLFFITISVQGGPISGMGDSFLYCEIDFCTGTLISWRGINFCTG